jgi:hypothetical protein
VRKDYDAFVSAERNQPWLPADGLPIDYRFPADPKLFQPGALTAVFGQVLGSPMLTGGLGVLPGLGAKVASNATLGKAATDQPRVPTNFLAPGDGVLVSGVDHPQQQQVLGSYLMLLAGPQPFSLLTFKPYAPPPASLSVMESILVQRAERQLAPEMMRLTLDHFMEELRKLKANKEKAAQFVRDTVKTYGLDKRLHEMSRAEDRYHLDQDPAMADFKKAYTKAAENEPRPPEFAGLFFRTRGTYDPEGWSASTWNRPGAMGWTFDPEPFVFWRTEDVAERQPNSLAEVRSQVEEAWRFVKARELAREAAQEIKKKVQERQERETPAEAVRFLGEQKVGGKVFEIPDLARLTVPKGAVDTTTQQYRPFVVPADKIAFPRKNFIDRLMDGLKKPGDALVVSDQPDRHFYVTVLLERVVPTRRDFLELYQLGTATRGGSFWSDYVMEDMRRDYRQRFLWQLRSDASGGKVDEDGKLILAEGIKSNVETGDQDQ